MEEQLACNYINPNDNVSSIATRSINTHILATSITPSLQVISESFNFSISLYTSFMQPYQGIEMQNYGKKKCISFERHFLLNGHDKHALVTRGSEVHFYMPN